MSDLLYAHTRCLVRECISDSMHVILLALRGTAQAASTSWILLTLALLAIPAGWRTRPASRRFGLCL